MTVAANDSPHPFIAVMRELGELQKDGHNEHQNFDYVSIGAIAKATRDAMANHGVMLLPKEVERSRDGQLVELTVTFSLIAPGLNDPDQYDSLTVVSTGASNNLGDKADNAAWSYARKNALLAIWNLAAEDPESEPGKPLPEKRPSGQPKPKDDKPRTQGGATLAAKGNAENRLNEANNDGYLGEALDAAVRLGLDKFIANKVKDEGPVILETLAPKAISFLIDGAAEAKGQR